jgi:hypothetical protein
MAEATLNDVVDALIDVRKEHEESSDAITKLTETMAKTFKMFELKADEEALQREEDRRESKTFQGKSIGGKPSIDEIGEQVSTLEFFKAALGGTFLGGLAGRIAGPIAGIVTAITANFIKPLIAIGKFFAKRTPLTIAIGLLYTTFKDIGENEEFRNAIQGIKDTWNNDVLPAWRDLKVAFTDFLNSDTLVPAINFIKDSWAGFNNWFTVDFKSAMYDLLVNTIGDIKIGLNTTKRVMELITEGKPWQAINLAFESIILGGIRIIDNLATAVLKSFGVDFGPEGTLGSKFNEMVYGIGDKFIESWNQLKIAVSVWGTSFKEMYDKKLENIKSMFDGIFTRAGEKINLIGSQIGIVVDQIVLKFNNAMDKTAIGFEKVSLFIQNIPDRLLRMLGTMLDFEIPPLQFPIKNVFTGGTVANVKIWPGGKPFEGLAQMGNDANSRITNRETESAGDIARMESDIANRLQELEMLKQEYKRNAQALSNITVFAPSSSSNVSSSNTNVMSFPSPINEYLPDL